jgi:hypothetical protein
VTELVLELWPAGCGRKLRVTLLGGRGDVMLGELSRRFSMVALSEPVVAERSNLIELSKSDDGGLSTDLLRTRSPLSRRGRFRVGDESASSTEPRRGSEGSELGAQRG